MTGPMGTVVGPKGRSAEHLFGMAHRHHSQTLSGDGTATEFALAVTVLRTENLSVAVGGILRRIAQPGVPYDYAVRGLTAGYPGDSNRIRFTVAPPPGTIITFATVGG